ncbi:hypothetical protein ACLK17_19805 [Escherichia coli]
MRTLQQAVQSGEYSDYQEYAKLVNERPQRRCAICWQLRRVKTRSTLLMLNRQANCLNALIPPRCHRRVKPGSPRGAGGSDE